MSKFSGAYGLVALGLVCVCGCSSDEKSGAATGTGGSGGRVATGGARTGGNSAVNPANCPATQPNQGDTCTQANLACVYASETCTCQQGFGGPGGGQAGGGGQAANLVFRCRPNQDAGAATGCAEGATCTVGDPNCTDANGATCRCRRAGFGPDAGTTGAYQCFGGGGGAGPGTGGSGNGGVAADCVVGNQCTRGTNCTSANGFCYCGGSGIYQGDC